MSDLTRKMEVQKYVVIFEKRKGNEGVTGKKISGLDDTEDADRFDN